MRDRRAFVLSCLGAAVLAQSAGCGGKVVFEEDGEGGSQATGGAGGELNPVTNSVSISSSASNSSVTTVGVGGGGPGLTEDAIFEGVTSDTLAIDLPVGTLGITALATTDDTFAEVQFTSLTAPSGSVVIDGFVPSNTYSWYWYGALGIAAPQVDHPESFPLASGAWSFQFQASAPAQVSMWRRSTADGVFHGGVLDVNVYIPDGLMKEDDALDALAIAYQDWGGIELGDVRFIPVSEDYYVVDESNIFDYALETNASQTRPALNILATGSIEGEFEGAAGFALGLPGHAMQHGTNASGVVWMVLYDFFGYDPIILRHEAGHFGGLFHTSEFKPGFGDPLDDTPQCADVESQFEDCPDYDHIMFPTGGSGVGLFSSKESTVLRGSTLYRGVYAEGEAPMIPYGPPLDEPTSGSVPHKASRFDIAQAKARAYARRGARMNPAAAWAGTLPGAVAAHLRGVGCASGSGTTYLDELESLGATDADEMIAVARDAGAPAYVRRRAALMAGRLGVGSPSVGDALDALARDVSQPGLLRSAALRALGKVSSRRAQAVAVALDGDGDKLVARAVAAVR